LSFLVKPDSNLAAMVALLKVITDDMAGKAAVPGCRAEGDAPQRLRIHTIRAPLDVHRFCG
jgi:hypothetical protein